MATSSDSYQKTSTPYVPPKNIGGLMAKKRAALNGMIGRKKALGSGMGKKVGLKRRMPVMKPTLDTIKGQYYTK